MSSTSDAFPQPTEQAAEMVQAADSAEKVFRTVPACLGRSLGMSMASMVLVTGFAFVAYKGKYAQNTRLRVAMSMRIGGPVAMGMYMFTLSVVVTCGEVTSTHQSSTPQLSMPIELVWSARYDCNDHGESGLDSAQAARTRRNDEADRSTSRFDRQSAGATTRPTIISTMRPALRSVRDRTVSLGIRVRMSRARSLQRHRDLGTVCSSKESLGLSMSQICLHPRFHMRQFDRMQRDRNRHSPRCHAS